MSTTATKTKNPPISAAERPKLEAAKQFLESCPLSRCTMKAAAKMAGLSEFHFHRRFRKAFGTTPKEIRTKRQIELAKSLMLTGLLLDDVAAKAGFAHQTHFISRFKAIEGVTPGEWRRVKTQEAIAAAAAAAAASASAASDAA